MEFVDVFYVFDVDMFLMTSLDTNFNKLNKVLVCYGMFTWESHDSRIGMSRFTIQKRGSWDGKFPLDLKDPQR